MRKITTAIALALVLIILQGCLLTRLHQTQKQVCSKKTRLEMTQEGVAIVFDQPLLTSNDIIAILGSKPVDTVLETDDLTYIARNKNDGANSIPFSFHFTRHDTLYKLARVNIGKRFQDFVSEGLLRKIFDAGCSAKRKGLGIEVDISGVPVQALPKADAITGLLGKPARVNGLQYGYEYELNGTDTAEIVVSFNDEKMTAAAISFQRYALVFDFSTGVATAALKRFSDALRFGFKR